MELEHRIKELNKKIEVLINGNQTAKYNEQLNLKEIEEMACDLNILVKENQNI